MTGFSVALDTRAPASSAQLKSILASVPARFHVTDQPQPDVLVVSGIMPDWIDRLGDAVERRVRAAFLTGVASARMDGLHDLARRAASTGTLVGVDIGFAADRAWRRAQPLVRLDVPSALLLDSVVTTTEAGPAALLAQIAVVRPLVRSLDRLQLAHQTDEHYVATDQSGSLPVNLTGTIVQRGSSSLQLDLVGQQSRWRLRINGDAVARPSEIVRFDSDGAHAQPLLYESPRRAVWLDLHAALTNGSPLAYTLDQLADDLALASLLQVETIRHMAQTSDA